MVISEISRRGQLSEDGKALLDKVSANNGITMADVCDEISAVIKSVSTSDAVNAAGWYFSANDYAASLANEFNTSLEIVSGIISAVSPRMPWLRNKRVAREILATLGTVASLSSEGAAKIMGLGLVSNVKMAIEIARGADIAETLSGVKRRSFYNNIVAPYLTDSVTVDTWMLQSYCNLTGKDKDSAVNFMRASEKALGGTGAGYILIADAVRNVASEMNMLPHQIQAIYWCAVSGSIDGGAAHTK